MEEQKLDLVMFGRDDLTPQRHEDGEEDGGRVIEQMTGPGRPTRRAQVPVAAHAVTQRTHGDVLPLVTDLHTANRTSQTELPHWTLTKFLN